MEKNGNKKEKPDFLILDLWFAERKLPGHKFYSSGGDRVLLLVRFFLHENPPFLTGEAFRCKGSMFLDENPPFFTGEGFRCKGSRFLHENPPFLTGAGFRWRVRGRRMKGDSLIADGGRGLTSGNWLCDITGR